MPIRHVLEAPAFQHTLYRGSLLKVCLRKKEKSKQRNYNQDVQSRKGIFQKFKVKVKSRLTFFSTDKPHMTGTPSYRLEYITIKRSQSLIIFIKDECLTAFADYTPSNLNCAPLHSKVPLTQPQSQILLFHWFICGFLLNVFTLGLKEGSERTGQQRMASW